MRREERVTVQGPVKEQQPDGMSHRGGLATLPITGRATDRDRTRHPEGDQQPSGGGGGEGEGQRITRTPETSNPAP